MKFIEAIGIRIKQYLDKHEKKQYDVFKEGGIPRSTLSELVNSKKKDVTVGTIYDICSTLGITLAEFFDDPIFNKVDD